MARRSERGAYISGSAMDGWSIYTTVFCKCGWVCQLSADSTFRCPNCNCDHFGQVLRVVVEVEPVVAVHELDEPNTVVVM